MVFSNLFFLYVFLPLLMLAYFILKNNAYRRGVLVAFSLLFYAWGEPVCVFLMIGLVAADYLFGRLIGSTRVQSRRKLWLTLAIVSNLGVLGFYKYLGFLTETVNAVFSVTIPVVSVSMPIGISFFTFQTMSYVIDVYREDADVQKSFFRLLLYVSFFPQLIAGPIVRYKDIEAQLESRAVPAAQFNDGLFRFAQGLAKKALIADSCATVINALYGLTDVTLLSRWAGAVFFTLQLYFDFSGYSDMAIGLGRMFGFRFLENFNYPYISGSITEFWRRWHMSLGNWFREYVYIPLGGNRKGKLKQYRNIAVVWFLTGFWHGANWNYILWGVYFGAILMLEKTFLLKILDRLPGFVRRLYAILLVGFGWILFSHTDLAAGWTCFVSLFGIGTEAFCTPTVGYELLHALPLLLIAAVGATPWPAEIWNRLSGYRWCGEGAVTDTGEQIPFTDTVLTARGKVFAVLTTVGCILLLFVTTAYLVDSTFSPFLYFIF